MDNFSGQYSRLVVSAGKGEGGICDRSKEDNEGLSGNHKKKQTRFIDDDFCWLFVGLPLKKMEYQHPCSWTKLPFQAKPIYVLDTYVKLPKAV